MPGQIRPFFSWARFTQRLLAFLLPALFLLSTPLSIRAQGEIDITITPDKTELTVGDVVLLALEIRHPAGLRAVIPALPQDWGDFEVRSQSPAEMQTGLDGSLITRLVIAVTLFTPGVYTTPSFSITFQEEDGSTRTENVPVVTLTVRSVLQEGEAQLRDIKPQAHLKPPFPWLGLLSGLLLAGIAAAAIWRLHRRQTISPDAPDETPNPYLAYRVALAELARIAGLRLPEAGRFKEHYTLLGNCLRRYLEDQFSLSARGRTTLDLRRELRRSSLPPQAVQDLLEIFSECDLVKFARFQPSSGQAHRCIEQARRLVEQSMPQPAAPSAEVQP